MSEARAKTLWSDHWERARESPERKALRNVAGGVGTGGGEPIPKGHRWTIEERDDAQPRRGDGTFGYKADIGEERKYADHGRHATKPLGVGEGEWQAAKGMSEGIKAGDVYERDGSSYVAIADLSQKQLMAYYTACRGEDGKMLIHEYFSLDRKGKGSTDGAYRSTGKRKEGLRWKEFDRLLSERGMDPMMSKYVSRGLNDWLEERAMSQMIRDRRIPMGDSVSADPETGMSSVTAKGRKSMMRDYVSKYGWKAEDRSSRNDRAEQAMKAFRNATGIDPSSIKLDFDEGGRYAGFTIPGVGYYGKGADISGALGAKEAPKTPKAPSLGERMQKHMDRGDVGFFESTSHGYNRKALANVERFMEESGLSKDDVLQMVRDRKLRFDPKTGRISRKEELGGEDIDWLKGMDFDF